MNRRAVEYAIRMILASGGEVASRSEFARKNYFYPDLPKGYQISQYDQPIGVGGAVHYRLSDGTEAECRLERIHLEEDAGKSIHSEGGGGYTLVDLNRCGVPLIEIVSAPELRGPDEAYAYLQAVRQLVRYLGISDADMEKGQLRCDANVSIRSAKSSSFGVRAEVKNLNSIKAVRRALQYEIGRQSDLLDSGGNVKQVTLMWNEMTQTADVMRSKEESEDYRYFPEPDLPPLQLESEWVRAIRESLPELPAAKVARLVGQYGIREYDALVLTADSELADYYETVAGECDDPSLAANWVINEVLAALREVGCSLSDWPIRPLILAELMREITSGRITGKIAKQVFAIMVEHASRREAIVEERISPKQIIDEHALAVISNEASLTGIVDEVLTKYSDQVTAYRAGKRALMGFFVGKVMEATNGRAEPGLASRMLKQRLDND